MLLSTCPECGFLYTPEGTCTADAEHPPQRDISMAGAQELVKARLRRFLAMTNDLPGWHPMWSAGGIAISWDDLRVLADLSLEPDSHSSGD